MSSATKRAAVGALKSTATRWSRVLPAAALALCANVATAAPFAYVTNGFAPSVSLLDTATNAVSTTVNFPAHSVPYAAAITPDLKKVYVTSMDSTSTCGPATGVYVIDTATNALEANAIAVGCEPTGIAITPDGLHVYVANQFGGTISVIDTATDTVTKTITVANGAPVTAIAITPDGGHAYVTAQPGVFVLDTTTNTVLGPAIPAGTTPQGIAITPDGKSVYVTDGALPGSGATVIDIASGKAVKAIAVGNNPSAVSITPDGKFAYVANGGINMGVFTVSVIDTVTQAVVGNGIQVDTFPNSIAITADGKQAYVGNEGGNDVSVIVMATDTVTTTVSGMNSPRGVATRPLPPGFPVPNYVGRPVVLVGKIIAMDGFTVGTVAQQSSPLAPGIILSQQPAAGALAGRGAAIDFIVASGIAVPNVVGQTQAAATTAITAAGLTLGSVTQQSSASVAPGSVISQSPASGTNVAGSSPVNLVVSSGSGGSGGGGYGGGGGGVVDVLMLVTLLSLGLARWQRRFLRHCGSPAGAPESRNRARVAQHGQPSHQDLHAHRR